MAAGLSTGDIIGLVSVAIALLSVVLFAFYRVAGKIDTAIADNKTALDHARDAFKRDLEAVDARHDEGSKLIHERISSWAEKFVNKDEFRSRLSEYSAQLVRLEMLLTAHGERSEKSQEAMTARIEKALEQQASFLREIDHSTRQRIGSIEQRLAVHEAVAAIAEKAGERGP